MGSILSSQKTSIIFGGQTPATVAVAVKGTKEVVRRSLQELVHENCPSLFKEFQPAWWLNNGHLQTLWCVLGDFTKVDHVKYSRTILRLLDGASLGLDFAPAQRDSIPANAPCVVVMHGLTGGSYEAYVRAILYSACKPVKEGGLGYRAVVVNFRGCAGTPLTTPQLYCAGYTDDLRAALLYITNKYPEAPLIGVGFSLGANVTVRYLAEEKEACRFTSAIALACPWDLKLNNDTMESTLIGKYAYSKGMASNLIKLLRRHTDAFDSFPTNPVSTALHTVFSLKYPTLEEFDNTFTRLGGGPCPPFPFDTATDYYNWASSHQVLSTIRRPLLALNSADDPVVQHVPVELGRENPHVVMVVTPGGGHLGWFELGSKRWYTKPTLEWLRMAGETMVCDKSAMKNVYVSEDGFLKEVGRDDLGCKEVEGGGTYEGDADYGLIQGL